MSYGPAATTWAEGGSGEPGRVVFSVSCQCRLSFSFPRKQLSVLSFELVQEQLGDSVECCKDFHAGAGNAFEALQSLLPVV